MQCNHPRLSRRMLGDIFHIVTAGGRPADGLQRRRLLAGARLYVSPYDRSATAADDQPRGSLMTRVLLDTSRAGRPSRVEPFIKRRRRLRRLRMQSRRRCSAHLRHPLLPSDVLAASKQAAPHRRRRRRRRPFVISFRRRHQTTTIVVHHDQQQQQRRRRRRPHRQSDVINHGTANGFLATCCTRRINRSARQSDTLVNALCCHRMVVCTHTLHCRQVDPLSDDVATSYHVISCTPN